MRRAVFSLAVTGCFATAMMGFGAATAAAENVAGDYCKAGKLAPGETCTHNVLHNFIETEGWSKGGTANCNGVESGGSWIGYVCNGTAEPPDEAYCTTACDGLSGFAFIHDHSAFASDVYTGWLDASK